MSVQTTYVAAADAFEGMLYDGGPQPDIMSFINQETEAGDGTDEMAFGHAVKFEGSSEDQGALHPTAETSVICGIVVHSHAYADDELGDVGVKPGAVLNILRRGKIWVRVPTGCAPGDRLWVRAVAGGGEEIGSCENADDSTDTVDCTNQGVFLTTAAADGLALLSVCFDNFPTVT
jgi:hypothetical protein